MIAIQIDKELCNKMHFVTALSPAQGLRHGCTCVTRVSRVIVTHPVRWSGPPPGGDPGQPPAASRYYVEERSVGPQSLG